MGQGRRRIARQRIEIATDRCVRTTATAIEALEHELSRVTGENHELRTRLAALESMIADLRLEARGDRKAIDLPNSLRSVN